MKPSVFRAILAAVGAALSALGVCMVSGTAAAMGNSTWSNTELHPERVDQQA
jgi:hypothetical protein